MKVYQINKIDDKIIAVPMKDPYYRDANSLVDLPKSRIEELKHFYATYKIKEGGHVEVRKMQDMGEAYKTINRCIEEYEEHMKNQG